MEIPQTKYAKSGDVSVAYQVTHVELQWKVRPWAAFFERLADLGRVIVFDKRGTGMSDRVVGIPDMEQRMDDVRAVMDAAGSERAALFGHSEGGNMCVLFAATHPERTEQRA